MTIQQKIGFRFTIAFFTVLVSMTAVSCNAQKIGEFQVLKGATLFDGTGVPAVENSVIVIRNDKVECVGKEGDCSIPAGAEIVNLAGKYITPGLVDAHVHFFQTAFFDSRPDALDLRETYPFMEVVAYQKLNPQRYYDAYLCSGITSVYDVGGATWSIDFQRSAEVNPQAPLVAASGPLLTPSTLDLFNTPSDKILVNLDSEETGRKTVQYLSALGSTGIKLWQLRADDESYMNRVEAVADEIEKRDNQMIVHATSLEQAKAAVRSGADLLVHSVADTAVDSEFLDMVKEEGTIYTPTLIVGSGYILAYRATAGIAPYQIEDPNGCVDTKTKNLLNNASRFKDHPRFTDGFKQRLRSFDSATDRVGETTLKNLKTVYDAGIPIAVGTDAGNPGTLHGISIYEEMEAMQRAGIPPEDLIVMATRNGAKAMLRDSDFGTLETGKYANLVVLERDPSEDISNMRSITHTMIKGTMSPVGEFAEN